MKINHRLALRFDDPLWTDLQAIGLRVDRGNDLIWVTNVVEDDELWPLVELHFLKRSHFVDNIFSKHEIETAEWLQLNASGHHGYPQPEDDFGYVEATYDVSNLCSACGVGGVQKAPFRLRREPKASHSQFIQLNWVFDEFFLREKAQKELISAGVSGIEFDPPVLHKSRAPSHQVTQMHVHTVLPPALRVQGLTSETCSPFGLTRGMPLESAYCGRTKYHLQRRGPIRFDRNAFRGAPDVVKSHEWFGSGGSAHRLVLVSKKFCEVVSRAKLRGVSFEPIAFGDQENP